MGVQSGINRLIGTIAFGAAAVSRVAAGLKEAAAKTSAAAMEKAKQGYEKSASTKAQNKKIEKSYTDLLNSTMPGVKDSKTKPEKVKQQEVLESSIKTTEEEKLLPQPKQKFILSEEGAEYPTIKADNSTTGIDAKDEDVATLIKVREKNQNRVMGGLHAWETRKERVTKGNNNPFATFKELEGNLNRKYDEFSPVTWDEARKLGLNKDTVLEFIRGYENQEGAGVDDLFEQLKTKFKDNEAALSLIQNYEDSFYGSGDAEEAASNSNVELKEHLYQLTQKLLSGDYKEYDTEYAAKKQLEAAESQEQTYGEEAETLKKEYEASKANKSIAEQESEEVKSWQKLLAERQSKQTDIEEPEVKEDGKYSVWDNTRDTSKFVF